MASLTPTGTEVQSHYVPGKEPEIISEEHWWWPYFAIKAILRSGKNQYYHSDLTEKDNYS